MANYSWPAISISASSGPIQFTKNAATVTVTQDTSTPANSIPLPMINLNTAGNETGTASVPFRVDPTGTTTQPVNVAQMNGVTTTMGNGIAGTGVQRVAVASDNTPFPVKIDQTTPGTTNLVALAANQSVNNAQINGVALLAGNGVTGTGSQRVTIASDNTPYAVKIDQTTPGTTNFVAANQTQMNGVALLAGNGVTGTGSQRVTIASDNTAFSVNATLQTGANTIGALTANQSVNVAQMNGVATTMGNGIAGTGVQRVAIASDNTAFSVNAVQSGTWTVQPGNTANTTAWLTTQITSSTATVTSVASSATTVSLLASNASRKNATFFNDSTQILYLKLGTTASTTSYTVQILAGGYYELPVYKIYTGAIDGIWASANGNARITELT